MCIYLYRKYRNRQREQERQQTQPQEHQRPQPQQDKVEKSKKTVDPCPHRKAADVPASQRCEICAAEKSATRKYRWKMLLLLTPGFMLSSLDLTIIATALPFIASHFGTSYRAALRAYTDRAQTSSIS